MLSLLSGRVFEVDFNEEPLGPVLTQSGTDPLPLVSPASVQVTSAGQALTVLDYQTLSVSVSPDEVADDAGPGAAVATVTRSNIADLADPQIVALSSSHPAVRVPATITIPAGHTSATVPLDVLDVAPFDGLKTVTITASAAGYVSIPDTLDVRDQLGASPGRLDPTFGDEGKLVASLGVSGERANSVVLQPDGKIVVAGQLNTYGGSKFALARYHPNGNLDSTFAENGTLAISVGTTAHSVANAIAIQSDGKIVVAGNSGGDFALARFNLDGSLDAGFDEDGLVTAGFGPFSDGAYNLAIQPDGKIVAVGHGGVNGTIGFALARYNPDGSLDSTFNGDGRVITHIGTGSSYGRSVALQADAKIVVAGYAYSGSNCSLALARYNSDGSLDATFDGDGTLLTSVGAGYDYGYSVAIQTDGKIVVAGQSDGSFLVIRYHPDGMLDTDFAGDGKVMVKVGSSSSARSLAIHDDGKIVVAGYTSNGSDDDFAMVRLDPTGGLDASFGNQGMLVTAFDSADDDWAFGLALQSDGRLVAAGLSGPKMALARYTATGTLDTSFGRDGKVTTSFGVAGSDRAHAVAIQPDGKIVAAGYAYNGRYLDFALSRYNSDGSPDTSFGVDGRLISGVFPSAWGIYAVATQPDGRILVAGDALGYFAIGRYESAGAVDTTFANDGIAMVWDSFTDFGSAEGIALQADGKIVVTGYADIGGPRGFAVVRLNPDGTLDTTFGASGTVTTPIGSLADAHSVVIQADGKIVVAGYAYKDFNRAFALVRYNSDGSLDTTFDGDGKVTTPVGISSELYSLALQADGKIVAAGRAEIRGKPAEFALARFNPDGSLDTSFDGDGTARLQIGNEGSYAYAVAIQRDGKILVAGSARNGNWDFALVRLNPDGSLDTTFNDGGITFTPFGAGTDEARALAIQPDGKMVLAGYAYNEGQFDFALARYAGDGPATVGIPNMTVDEDAPDTVIDLFAAFADPTDPVSALTFTVTGNTDPSLFASLAVDLAAGTLTLDYAANAHGSAAITVRATDPVGWYVETAFTVSVHPPNGAPTISDIADQSVNRLETLTFTVSATDADLPANTLTYHLDDDSGAAGMTIDAATGRFTWTPGATQGGRSYTVTVIVTDDGTPPLSDSVTFSISVSGPVWQNPAHPCDVNGDGSVTPADVLPLINEINANGARDLTTGGPSTPAPPPFLDPTGDNYVSAADVLMVVNYINAWGSGAIPGPPAASALGGEGERADKAAVPFATASGLSPVARRDALNPVAGGRASPPDDWQRAVALVHAGRQSRERHGEFGLTKRERMERDDDDLAFWWAGVEDAVAAIARQAAADSLSSGARLGRGRR